MIIVRAGEMGFVDGTIDACIDLANATGHDVESYHNDRVVYAKPGERSDLVHMRFERDIARKLPKTPESEADYVLWGFPRSDGLPIIAFAEKLVK